VTQCKTRAQSLAGFGPLGGEAAVELRLFGYTALAPVPHGCESAGPPAPRTPFSQRIGDLAPTTTVSEGKIVFDLLSTPRAAAAIDRPSEVLSFEQVYDAHFDFVWRYTRERGVPSQAVADVVQEIFIVIYRKLGSLEDRCSLQTWIAMVARRAARDHLRKRGNRPIGEPLEERGVSSWAEPAEILEQRATLRWLEHLLSRMTEIQREVFILHEIEHMTGAEISEALGVNENTIHARLRAARRVVESGVDVARRVPHAPRRTSRTSRRESSSGSPQK